MKMGDEGSSTDEGKKRKDISREDILGRNKKMFRSPPRRQREEDEGKLDQILKMMTEMSRDQKEMKIEQSEIKKEILESRTQQKIFNERLQKLETENKDLKRENQDMKRENAKMREELQRVERTLEAIEKERKKTSVVMYGLKIDTNELVDLKEESKRFLREKLQIDITPRTVIKTGEKTLVIHLNNEEEKNEIMMNKAKLKNMTEEPIFINDDMTPKEREKQRQLRDFAKKERAAGKTVKMGYSRVIVDGEEWRWNRRAERIEKQVSKN